MKTIKRLLTSLMVVALLLTTAPVSGFVDIGLPNIFDVFASAETSTGTCGDNLIWSLNAQTGEFVISGEGAMSDYVECETPWENNRGKIKTVIIGDGVTSIGISAFRHSYSLTEVSISDSIKYIGESAFEGCDSLTGITIGNGVVSIGDYAFFNCYNLTNIKFPNGIKSIGKSAFRSCNMKSIIIPGSVTSIGEGAFNGCDALTDITVSAENLNYSNDEHGVLFNKDKTEIIFYPIGNTRTEYIIPDSVTQIGYSAFMSNENLTSIIIPESVISIGDGAFSGCFNLTDIIIPEKVASIGEDTFYNCIRLTSVTIPDSVTSIDDGAFYYCTSLTSITISDNVTSIGEGAFCYCTSLESITIGSGLKNISAWAFDYCPKLTNVYYNGTENAWNNISIDKGNDKLLNSTIHFKEAVSVVLGDPTGDNRINSSDALVCLKHSVGKIKLEGEIFDAADVDKDGLINSGDALKILQFAVGKINKF